MNSVIIVAAGKGTRMKREINKAFIDIDGKEILAHTIDVFYNNPQIDEIIVAVSKYEVKKVEEDIIKKNSYRNIKIAIGGKERQDSIYNSLKELSERSNIVLIHDAARPFIDRATISKVIGSASKNGASIVAVPVKDTIKVVSGTTVADTPPRASLWAAQTPQAFHKSLIVAAHEKAREDRFTGTDDSSLVERLGKKVSIVEGSYDNIKITTPEDLDIAQMILDKRRRKKFNPKERHRRA